MELNEGYLTVTNPLKDLASIKYDIRDVLDAEARTAEIAVMTPQKSAELMAVFSRACFTLVRTYSDLLFQHRLAERRFKERRAILVIDIIPGAIKDKGLTQNETTRQALMDLDPEYAHLEIIEAQLDAARTYIQGKLRAMEGNLNAVKKILGDTSAVYNRGNPYYNTGGLDSGDIVEQSPQDFRPQVTETSGIKIGKSRY
jgi:hypothetical protein